MQAKRVMTLEITAAPPELPLETASQLMQKLRVRHLPVVAGGKLCGILSDRDVLLRTTVGRDGTRTVAKVSAGEAMSLCPTSCGPNTPVAAIAGMMVDHRIDAIPIIEVGGQLVGLVTSTDLLELLRSRDLLPEELPFTFSLKRFEDVALGARA